MCVSKPKTPTVQATNPLLQAPAEQGAADLTHLLIGTNRPNVPAPVGLDALELNLGLPSTLSGLAINRGK